MITKPILAVTGHRPDKLGGYDKATYERLLTLAVQHIPAYHPSTVITGMALGWDTAVAEAAFLMQIPFKAYVPFRGQESMWPPASQKLYRNLLKEAYAVIECSSPGYSVEKMQIRNKRMVDDSDLLLALWDGSSGGTANAVNYAMSKNRNMVNLWSEWIKP